ncbi:heparinase II/III family protein [Hyphomicrobium sp.]|uniref:heparinase II/III family protein n=1 Tax=Hyphomicrobium sp. TaxID=82 RepID=UPI002CD6A185|nr:heparinase II/III family protein [Hyphomicrobium sp.]HVZ05971.1 heparinase II/III family protein [Hyphomicrobium sp.]
MSSLNVTERLKIRSLSVERLRRRAVTRTLSSPLFRWRYAGTGADQILIVPQELRAADPSFWSEVAHGHFGLASQIADLKGASPFRVDPPSLAWARELHGFGWLRHLAATEEEEAAAAARELVLDWIATRRVANGIAYEPEVVGRRLISWIAQANMLLEGLDARSYSAILSSIGQQIVALKTTWRSAPDGIPRLVCLIALVLSDLSVSGHDRQLKEALDALIEELNRQILDDGGHISRSASVLADLILDLLPLGQCFHSRGRQPPEEINAAVRKSLGFLRFMRLGDGMLARFNGVSTGSPATLATVLAYSAEDFDVRAVARASGYARLERGDTIIVADVGPPPPLEMATEAQAGALSFELTSRQYLVLANGGFPGPADHSWDSAARATASHNTLCLAGTSSSRLVRHAQLEDMIGGLPIRGPDSVTSEYSEETGYAVLRATHDGYLKRYGLIHTRQLSLSPDGHKLDGMDTLGPPKGQLRLKQDLPYAIHFHLHPDCRCTLEDRATCRVKLPDGRFWVFRADDASLSIEESLFYVDSAGPRPALQIVLRGTTFGETEVHWSMRAETADVLG